MTNPHKGEVPFKAGDKDYILSFSANAVVETTVALGCEFEEVIEKLRTNKIKLAEMRVLFWQGLLDNHESLTLDDTKAILKHLRPIQMGELIGKALLLAMPQAPDDAPPPPEPGDPASGTGPASSTPGPTSEDQKRNSGG